MATRYVKADTTRGVRVYVGNISDHMWSDLGERFLWDTPRNSVLADRPGDIFVKDIWVGRFDFRLGYNLDSVKIDRDRRLIDPSDLRWEVSKIVNAGLALNTLTATQVLGMLEGDKIGRASCRERV